MLQESEIHGLFLFSLIAREFNTVIPMLMLNPSLKAHNVMHSEINDPLLQQLYVQFPNYNYDWEQCNNYS